MSPEDSCVEWGQLEMQLLVVEKEPAAEQEGEAPNAAAEETDERKVAYAHLAGDPESTVKVIPVVAAAVVPVGDSSGECYPSHSWVDVRAHQTTTDREGTFHHVSQHLVDDPSGLTCPRLTLHRQQDRWTLETMATTNDIQNFGGRYRAHWRQANRRMNRVKELNSCTRRWPRLEKLDTLEPRCITDEHCADVPTPKCENCAIATIITYRASQRRFPTEELGVERVGVRVNRPFVETNALSWSSQLKTRGILRAFLLYRTSPSS